MMVIIINVLYCEFSKRQEGNSLEALNIKQPLHRELELISALHFCNNRKPFSNIIFFFY